MDEIFQLSQSQLKFLNKPYRRALLQAPELSTRLCIVLGPRGIGKTTALAQHLMDQVGGDVLSREILYVQADHFLIRNRHLYEIAEHFVNIGGRVVCFDEIHKYPAWSMELKSMADTFPELKILASGSSALEIHRTSHDLSRRAVQKQVWGLSFREYLELSLDVRLSTYVLEQILSEHATISLQIVDRLAPRKILAFFNDYLRHGYYPFFFAEPNETIFQQILNQNLLATLEGDLVAVHPALTGNSIKRIDRLLRVLSTSVPFTPDLKKLTELTEIGDQRTLKTYLKLLEDSGLTRSLLRTSKGLRAMEKPEKIFLNNPNLIHAFAARADRGTLRETFFLSMLAPLHEVLAPERGDFLVNDTHVFEIGGRKKTFEQIKDAKQAFLALDEMEHGFGSRIPLWLFGFLY
ncbi:ATP-binding protein [Desulfonatronum thioautotrophicum]|uniref:ATP-binding protein n=1 Tax=Desulfonatronum thioautotrophicum TaxID=617001 RepID=UPI0005EB4408|nr:AAA family ATPase [Desulfonatronum thioautotrophicum]